MIWGWHDWLQGAKWLQIPTKPTALGAPSTSASFQTKLPGNRAKRPKRPLCKRGNKIFWNINCIVWLVKVLKSDWKLNKPYPVQHKLLMPLHLLLLVNWGISFPAICLHIIHQDWSPCKLCISTLGIARRRIYLFKSVLRVYLKGLINQYA